jgi:hypothetical protein
MMSGKLRYYQAITINQTLPIFIIKVHFISCSISNLTRLLVIIVGRNDPHIHVIYCSKK